ncbi:LutB/LldF family L-lactate oxidation iron-sulfur protein [Neisseria weaveri]|uniref:(Fe-S)-binding protein n=1 Tax=Neisseria weaveri TaxID=28091 RepID=A0A3S5C3I8_9NEIS|nr:LutB/LldF family L-lactate oxidation iron-sulfur protein [Neisseria weaveri]EGV36331.1 iron-sulfur cluster-binding protein [Neisseria weaveri ATCC 51223]EGV38857.1 iron-sulfur cluster-binding protein [Neisseria weaveri LMG 5135]SAY51356.1 (Fe-S)-binding protein [Neisseria weaveri]VEJ50316.1 (Fe-S)-binding protein [Neisseria weaveri]
MTEQIIHIHPKPETFKENARKALADKPLRKSLRTAMDMLMTKRKNVLSDEVELQGLRTLCEHIRQRSLAKLPDLLEQLESNLTRLGVKVHWAETPEEACTIIHNIITARNGKLMVKGKSMVSEEIELNHYLEGQGIQAVESDLGEYIVQMAGEKPTHIVMPAIHKTKEQVSELFHNHLGTPKTDDVDELTGIARRALRDVYRTADVGLSGVNFAVAETGTLCLVENEGNGRLTTTVPPVHIAITGIEKVVAKLSDIPPLYSLLPRSAIGQNITTYFNMITGPRRSEELDGPQEMHLVLLDNGRSQAYGEEQMRRTLQCIRCGACMNHCPVYTRIGGAAYGTTYPGPIGEIVSPHMLGLDATRDLPTACTLCGACNEVCPVRIPITEQMIRLRTEAQRSPSEVVPYPIKGQGASHTFTEDMAWRTFNGIFSGKKAYRAFGWAATKFRTLTPGKQLSWTQNRVPLKPATKTLHEMVAEKQKQS